MTDVHRYAYPSRRRDEVAAQEDDIVVHDDRETMVVDDDGVDSTDLMRQVGRFVALVVGGVVTALGLVAVARINWDGAELDSPIVDAARMTFTPAVAIATASIGVLLMLVAAFRDGEGRIALGGLLTIVGVVVLMAEDVAQSWHVTDRQGWLAVGVGVVFLLTGALSETRYLHRRQRRTYVDA